MMADKQTDGYRELIREMGKRRQGDKEAKATFIRRHFEKCGRVQSDLLIDWVDGEPRQTTSTPAGLMDCVFALAGIHNEWQRRFVWHDYWKDEFEYELSRKS